MLKRDINSCLVRDVKVDHNACTKETKTENTGAEKSKLFPTDIGMVVNDFLLQYFPTILDFNFAAFAQANYQISPELSAQAGLRASEFLLANKFVADPRLAFRYQFEIFKKRSPPSKITYD